MIIINTANDNYFTLNGVQYPKIYNPIIQGLNTLGIYNIYDVSQQIVNSTYFDEFQINNQIYNSVEDTIQALLPVIYNVVSDGTSSGDSDGLLAHLNDYQNPHLITKYHINLGNVENLAPEDLPISDDTQNALDVIIDEQVVQNTSIGNNSADIAGNAADISTLQAEQLIQNVDIINITDELTTKSDIIETGRKLIGDANNSTISLLDINDNVLDTLSVAFLNNEGTTLTYNSSNETIEIKNDDGDLLSSIPVSAFLSNLPDNISLVGSSLRLRDSANNILSAVQFSISNINGLEVQLDDISSDVLGNNFNISTLYTLVDNKADEADLISHTGNTNNPHNVTASQVGLDNVENLAPEDLPISDDTQEALDNKLDIDGDGSLLTNVNAQTLDALDSTDFVRRTGYVDETITGIKNFDTYTTSQGYVINTNSTSENNLFAKNVTVESGGWARDLLALSNTESSDDKFRIGVLGGGTTYHFAFIGYGDYSNLDNLRLTPNGKLGLGITPIEKLHIANGNIKTDDLLFNQGGKLWLNATKLDLQANSSYDGLRLTTTNFKPIEFYTNGTLQASIKANGDAEFNNNISNKIGSGGSLTLYDDDSTRNNRIVLGANDNGSFIYGTYSSGGNRNLLLNATGGNVGIGTTSPTEKLEVDGNIKGNNFIGDNIGLGVGVDSNYTANVLGDAHLQGKLRLKNNVGANSIQGQVGIEFYYSNDDILNSWGTLRGSSNNVFTYGVIPDNTVSSKYLSSANNTSWIRSSLETGNRFEFKSKDTTDVAIGEEVDLTSRFYINASNGNVGINNDSPIGELHIKGNNEILIIDSTSGTGNPFIGFRQNGVRRSAIQHQDTSDMLSIISEYGGIKFLTGVDGAESEKARFNQAGYLGIGTNVPTEKLHIANGNVKADNFIGDGSQLNNVDAETLDGLNSTDFLLVSNNLYQEVSGVKNFTNNTGFGVISPVEAIDVDGVVKADGFKSNTDISTTEIALNSTYTTNSTLSYTVSNNRLIVTSQFTAISDGNAVLCTLPINPNILRKTTSIDGDRILIKTNGEIEMYVKNGRSYEIDFEITLDLSIV